MHGVTGSIPVVSTKNKKNTLASAFLAEKTRTPPRKFFGGVFVVGNLRKAPSGRELDFAWQKTEGERVTIKSAQIASHAGSFHHFVVPLPPGGRLLCAVPLRIVGSGFCPIVRGHPRAMLAPDASVGKSEKTSEICIFQMMFEKTQ